MSPILDVFITLLSVGRQGLTQIRRDRKQIYKSLREELAKVAARHGERVLETKHNTISIAMTLDSIVTKETASVTEDSTAVSTATADQTDAADRTFLGSMLFKRCVSGTRVVLGRGVGKKTIGDTTFIERHFQFCIRQRNLFQLCP